MAIINRKLLSATPAPSPSPYPIPDGLSCQLESCAPYGSPVSCLHCVEIYVPLPPPPLPTRQNGFENHIVPYLITMVCILGIVFLVLTTCTILLRQRWTRQRRSSRRVSNIVFEDGYFDDDGSGHGPIDHPIWHIATVGLAQSVIDSIATFKYHKYEGFVIDGSGDCSVCLTEFEDGDDLRLLPKCSHAFHVSCIDTWLRSHKNCPLCRAPIVNELTSSTGSGRGTNVAVVESSSESNGSDGGGSQSGRLMVDYGHNLGNNDPGGGEGSGRHSGESSCLNIRERDDDFGVFRIESLAMDEILKKQHEHFRVHSDFGVMPVEGMTIDAILKKHREQHLRFHSNLGLVPIDDVPMDEMTRKQQHAALRANSDLCGYRIWMDEGYEPIRRSMSFSFSLINSSLKGEESSSSKLGKSTVYEKDAAGKQHEVQEHHDDDTKSESTSSGSTKSSSIGRLLQKGPVSMKRSISSGGRFFSSFRKSKSQAAGLPL